MDSIWVDRVMPPLSSLSSPVLPFGIFSLLFDFLDGDDFLWGLVVFFISTFQATSDPGCREWLEAASPPTDQLFSECELLVLCLIDRCSREDPEWFADAKDLIDKLRQVQHKLGSKH